MLTILFALAAIAIQVILRCAMPQTGMGSMGLYFVVWPALAISTITLFFVLRLLRHMRVSFTTAFILVMVIASISAYPQDTPLSFSQKLDALRDWTMQFLG